MWHHVPFLLFLSPVPSSWPSFSLSCFPTTLKLIVSLSLIVIFPHTYTQTHIHTFKHCTQIHMHAHPYTARWVWLCVLFVYMCTISGITSVYPALGNQIQYRDLSLEQVKSPSPSYYQLPVILCLVVVCGKILTCPLILLLCWSCLYNYFYEKN